MKILRTLLLPMLVLTFLAACNTETAKEPATAETPAAKEQPAKRMVNFVDKAIKRLEKEIELSPEQLSAIKEIGKSYDFANMKKADLVRERKAFRERIFQEVLTPEQAAVFQNKK
ncbi:MAG: hypothetical protein AAF990_02070 [Bacteroidota bacterium]